MNRGSVFVIVGLALVGFAVAFTVGLRVFGAAAERSLPPDGPMITTTPVQRAPPPPAPTLDLEGPSAREVATTDAYAALAAAAGVGRVLCELPNPGPPEEDRLRGLEWQSRFQNRVYALVPSATGVTSIGGADPSAPAFVAWWTDALPGEPGVCEVEKRRLLEHRVTVAEPRAALVQHTCHDLTVDTPGVWVVRSIARLPCTITVQHEEQVGQLTLQENEPTNTAVLTLGPPPDPAPEPTVTITAEHLATAGEAAGLSPEARLLLKRFPPTVP